jgi:hypothetical protein
MGSVWCMLLVPVLYWVYEVMSLGSNTFDDRH